MVTVLDGGGVSLSPMVSRHAELPAFKLTRTEPDQLPCCRCRQKGAMPSILIAHPENGMDHVGTVINMDPLSRALAIRHACARDAAACSSFPEGPYRRPFTSVSWMSRALRSGRGAESCDCLRARSLRLVIALCELARLSMCRQARGLHSCVGSSLNATTLQCG